MESNQCCCLLHPKSLCIGLVWLSSFEFLLRFLMRKFASCHFVTLGSIYHLWIGGSETSDPTFVLGTKKFAVETWVVLQPLGPNTLFKQNLYWRRTIPDIFVMTNCCDSWGCLILRSSTDAHLNFLWYCSLSQIIYVLNLKMHSLFLHLIIQGLDRMFGRFWNTMKLWKRAGRYPCVHMCVIPRENLFALPSWESWFCLIPRINHHG